MTREPWDAGSEDPARHGGRGRAGEGSGAGTIKGGLILLGIAQIFITIRTAMILVREVDVQETTAWSFAGGSVTFMIERALLAGLFLLAVATTAAMLGRRSSFRPLFVAQCVGLVGLCLMDSVVVLSWVPDPPIPPRPPGNLFGMPVTGLEFFDRLEAAPHKLLQQPVHWLVPLSVGAWNLSAFVLRSDQCRRAFSR